MKQNNKMEAGDAGEMAAAAVSRGCFALTFTADY
jgi:hypothetical protein